MPQPYSGRIRYLETLLSTYITVKDDGKIVFTYAGVGMKKEEVQEDLNDIKRTWEALKGKVDKDETLPEETRSAANSKVWEIEAKIKLVRGSIEKKAKIEDRTERVRREVVATIEVIREGIRTESFTIDYAEAARSGLVKNLKELISIKDEARKTKLLDASQKELLEATLISIGESCKNASRIMKDVLEKR